MNLKQVLTMSLTAMLSISALGNSALAASKSDSITRAVPFVIVTDIGPQIFAVTQKCHYSENYTKGSSYIRYTYHTTSSWLEGWTGSAFGDVTNYNCHQVDYYDSNGNYVKSANLYTDGNLMFDPDWDQYDAATGTDIATVNTSSSMAVATFMVACYDSLYAPSTVDIELTCN